MSRFPKRSHNAAAAKPLSLKARRFPGGLFFARSRSRPATIVDGLFFGAGNLIFPAGLGRDAGAAVTPATLGFLVTAVGLPVLGIVASAVTGEIGRAHV